MYIYTALYYVAFSMYCRLLRTCTVHALYTIHAVLHCMHCMSVLGLVNLHRNVHYVSQQLLLLAQEMVCVVAVVVMSGLALH